MNWNWLSEAIIRFGCTINYRLGYEIYEEPATRSFCKDCYSTEKKKNMLNELNEELL